MKQFNEFIQEQFHTSVWPSFYKVSAYSRQIILCTAATQITYARPHKFLSRPHVAVRPKVVHPCFSSSEFHKNQTLA